MAVTIEQWDLVGCPEEYAPSPMTYEDASLVSLNGVVYQCKPHVSRYLSCYYHIFQLFLLLNEISN